jgi:hypothetical protein
VAVRPPGFLSFLELLSKFDLLSHIAQMCIFAVATAIIMIWTPRDGFVACCVPNFKELFP